MIIYTKEFRGADPTPHLLQKSIPDGTEIPEGWTTDLASLEIDMIPKSDVALSSLTKQLVEEKLKIATQQKVIAGLTLQVAQLSKGGNA